MIQNVEKLGTELCIEAIRDPLDVVVLEQGEIELRQSWSNECVPAEVAAKCNGIWYREALRLDVADGIPRIHQRTATWPGNQVWNIDVWVCAFHPERVSTETWSKRNARAGLKHTPYLPSP